MGYRSRYNMAVSYHIKEAIDDNMQIIFNKLMISKGELQGVQEGTATAEAAGTIKLSWLNNSGQGMALPADSLLAVIYAPDLSLFEVFEYTAVRGKIPRPH